ncbi:MAG: hypothetical protein IKK70_05345 [Clostridia bacterium]|nr:hypothetical protein [Clostridia bacterium]
MKATVTRILLLLILACVVFLSFAGCDDSDTTQSDDSSSIVVGDYPEVITYNITFGSEAYRFVYDEALIKQFVDMIDACEFTEVASDDSSVTPFSYGNYYDFRYDDFMIMISKDGGYAKRGAKTYKVVGFDASIFEELEKVAKT